MFQKILIANRGEIAVRVIRACREMGISAVAIYSEADREALHVRRADEAYCVGPAPSLESYLAVDRILDVARRCGAEAVHPGYGFLSENSRFVQACEESGILFIGPTSDAMKVMGSKVSARQVAVRAQVPVVPGTLEPVASVNEALAEAERIGYPVMLKAAAGGGGKGLRLVPSAPDLPSAFEMAASEAENAFNDRSLYLEKYLDRPHHIEIQVLADSRGDVVYLGERECSIQRRHQKVVEECPSPLVTRPLRKRMGETAVRLARQVGYLNAGTMEFLVDSRRNFYFLEMNTRLQVEHPVTEFVTGIDLVKAQIRIAAGEALPWRQQDIRLQGAAIECRVYAEDPERNFLPSPGKITHLEEPDGPGIRNDSGVYPGYTVPIHYDPLISKLVAYGKDRREAVERMRRALSEYKIGGIQTTLPFLEAVLADAQFLRGDLDTGFADRLLAARPLAAERDHLRDVAILAAAIAFSHSQKSPLGSSERAANPWKMAARLDQLATRLPH